MSDDMQAAYERDQEDAERIRALEGNEDSMKSTRLRLLQARCDAYWRRWLRTRRPWRSDQYDTMPREMTPAEQERYREIMKRRLPL